MSVYEISDNNNFKNNISLGIKIIKSDFLVFMINPSLKSSENFSIKLFSTIQLIFPTFPCGLLPQLNQAQIPPLITILTVD